MKGIKLFSCLFLLCIGNVFGQNSTRPILERTISLNVKSENLKSTLDKVATQGKFSFSYPSNLIDQNKKVNLIITKKTVREVIYILFGSTVNYKVKGNYIILSEVDKKEIAKPASFFILNGYVIDDISGEKIASVSIYEGTKMISTVTNKYGYFSIKFDDPKVQIKLKVSKQNYQDTLVTINQSTNNTVSIKIKPESLKLKVDSTIDNEIPIVDFLIPEETSINTINIKDTIYRKYQISFIPIIGSNFLLSGNVINDYSLNILGGYSRGTRKAEIGGLFNINREDSRWIQIAGLANAVGGRFDGIQIGGLFNLVRKRTNGIQIGGLANVNWDSVNAFQVAGLFNINRKYTNSFQIAGLVNALTDSSDGVQIAGLINTNIKSFNGVQFAGISNVVVGSVEGLQITSLTNVVTKNVRGIQYAALSNVVIGKVEGVQLSGLFNYVGKELSGIQFAPLMNYAKNVNGVQLGLINVSDTCNGTPIGLFSYVHSGYHQLEISSDEIFNLNIGFRTGTKEFHNILFVGADPTFGDTVLWTFGYGLGSTFKLNKKWNLDFDLTTQQINNGEVGPKINLLNKFVLDFEYKLTKGIHLTTGPVLSAQLYNSTFQGYPEIFRNFNPNVFYNKQIDKELNLKMWIGWKVGIRFF